MEESKTAGVIEAAGYSQPTGDNEGLLGAIGEKLGGQEQEHEKKPDLPTPQQAIPFDIGKLSPDQLQLLKAQLAVTPERVSQKKGNPTTILRKIGDRFVVAIGKAYLALVYDATRLTEVETHKIRVRFNGDDKDTDIVWTDLQRADRVPCEIVSVRTENSTRKEGEIVQRETGKLIDMEVTMINYFFTVKLPNGTLVEVAGEASNA